MLEYDLSLGPSDSSPASCKHMWEAVGNNSSAWALAGHIADLKEIWALARLAPAVTVLPL